MKLRVNDMTCGGCARAVTATIKDIDENAEVSIDVDARLVDVQTSAAVEAISAALDEAGFPPEVIG